MQFDYNKMVTIIQRILSQPHNYVFLVSLQHIPLKLKHPQHEGARLHRAVETFICLLLRNVYP